MKLRLLLLSLDCQRAGVLVASKRLYGYPFPDSKKEEWQGGLMLFLATLGQIVRKYCL